MVASRPIIFISAVSRELHSARDLVAKTLISLGYEPKWQDIAPTEAGDLRAVLRKWVDESHAVLQIVGHRYGHGPKEPDENFGQVSYTQFEALYAKTKGKKVWYIILDEHHPTDCPDDEPDELRQRQADYRIQVKAHHGLYHNSPALLTTENIVLKLRDDLAKLRRRGKQWATIIIALLSLAIGGIGWMVLKQDRAGKKLTGIDQGQKEQTEELKLLRQGQADMRQMLESTINGGSEEKLRQDYDASLRFIASRRGLSLTAFQQWLEQNATLTVDDPSVSLKDKILAMQEAGQFVQARDFALRNADRLAAERQQSKREEIELRIAASQAEITLGHYPAAHEQATKALSLADQKQDFATWGMAKHQMGRALIFTGEYKAALKLYEDLVPLRESGLGKEHPDTLKSRINLALLLGSNGKPDEAADEYRALILVCERVLGPEHPVTLKSRINFASALASQGKNAEAEKELRAVLAVSERVLGPEHPDTLSSRNNLASALDSQGKYLEAEKEILAVLAISERVLGPEHPDTLRNRMTHANSLYSQGKFPEAEKEHRAVLAIKERVLGPEHPDILGSRNNLANALYSQGKYPEAEEQHRAVLAIKERVLGPEHPDTLNSRNNLAIVLNSQGKYPEAEKEIRDVLAIRERVLGPEHPEVFRSCYNLSECLKVQGKKPEAAEFAWRALEGWTRVLLQDHPDTKDAKRQVEDLEKE